MTIPTATPDKCRYCDEECADVYKLATHKSKCVPEADAEGKTIHDLDLLYLSKHRQEILSMFNVS